VATTHGVRSAIHYDDPVATHTIRLFGDPVLKRPAAPVEEVNGSLAKLVGANKEYIEKQIPHLSSLLCNTIDEVIDKSEVIVVGNQAPEFAEALMKTRKDQIIIDLVRLPIYGSLVPAEYRGLCW